MRQEPTPATSPSGGDEKSAGLPDQAPPTLGRAGAEAPGGGMPAADSELIVIDWDRVRRHAGADVDRGVNVRRHDDTGGFKALPAATPAPTPATAEGAGAPP